MLSFTEAAALREWLGPHVRAGRRIGLVPTMGALHDGHLSLVAEARRGCDVVVMSVFVNPLQFGPSEDYQRYPRDAARDTELARGSGVDGLFLPTVEAMYPPGSEVRVVPGGAARLWEGAVRPGHFEGVLTVVAKLFHLVQPHLAVFGQKDIQQAVLVRQMVRDLDFPLEVRVSPTVREPDGLALSSRNAYLSEAERRQALGLSQALRAADRAWRAGERRREGIAAALEEQFGRFPGLVPDYIAIVDPDTLVEVPEVARGTIIAVAGRVGRTRLLDNLILGMEFR